VTWRDLLDEQLLYKWKIKRSNESIRDTKEGKNGVINRRKEALIKKAYKLVECNGIEVAMIICKNGRYTHPPSGGLKPTDVPISSCYPAHTKVRRLCHVHNQRFMSS
jgi:hypothetical protein